MYALLLPSAHSFISSVEEKVNVDVRQMLGPTGAPTPWRFGSPAWTERVCGPHFSVLEFFMVLELLAFTAIPGKHHFGATRRRALCLVVGVLISVRLVRGDYFFRQLVGHVVVVGKFHGVRSATLCL